MTKLSWKLTTFMIPVEAEESKTTVEMALASILSASYARIVPKYGSDRPFKNLQQCSDTK